MSPSSPVVTAGPIALGALAIVTLPVKHFERTCETVEQPSIECSLRQLNRCVLNRIETDRPIIDAAAAGSQARPRH